MDEQDFINQVRKYAMDHYTKGWDYVVECWADGDILEYWSEADGNTNKAFRNIASAVNTHREYANEIRSTAF
jgi:hypothetical protein